MTDNAPDVRSNQGPTVTPQVQLANQINNICDAQVFGMQEVDRKVSGHGYDPARRIEIMLKSGQTIELFIDTEENFQYLKANHDEMRSNGPLFIVKGALHFHDILIRRTAKRYVFDSTTIACTSFI